MATTRFWLWLASLLVLLVILMTGCLSGQTIMAPGDERAPTPAGLPRAGSTVVASSEPAIVPSTPAVAANIAMTATPASETSRPSATPTMPVNTATPTPCQAEVCTYPGHFVFQKPIAPPGRNTVDGSYRYGSTQDGLRETHHGVEFLNSQGTPVLAAAAGTVVVAGNDHDAIYADWPYFYGNLVVIEHRFPEIEQPVYSLYAHLSAIDTRAGVLVRAGQQIGQVGFTGSAEGSHLHFEVRVGQNEYESTRNPELWLGAWPGGEQATPGAIAGRVVDEYGAPIEVPSIVIERLSADGSYVLESFYLQTYADHTVNGDDVWQENFALGDLPPGLYRVSFVVRGLQVYELEVQPGMVTFISFDAAQH
ncbi:MAG: peptidoglycan DD-metalloendopeptidase family protein [Anaerolineales bacterium]|nr:peptidoglycan DD-metalloendopeptidase family protein [Anaerolineales bacterium]